MRVLIALLLTVPIAGIISVKSGFEQILPLIVAMTVLAIIAQIIIEMRYEEEVE